MILVNLCFMNISPMPHLSVVFLVLTSISLAQTELSFQDAARPLGLDIVGPVMEAGSDADSAVFQVDELPTLRNFVRDNLSENQALADLSGVSLDPEALLLSSESNVRVYFLQEGAAYRNTLGFSTESVSSGEASDDLLIFPDASAKNRYYSDPSILDENFRSDDRPLIPGDFVDLGVYEGGTLIDFFLIGNGANGGTHVYTADATTNPDQMQHVVAFAIPDSPYLMIGFEDVYGGGDLDFNDLVFAVDIGELNVAYLANPEPAVWLMMLLVLGLGYCVCKKGGKGLAIV
jgi:hypothetical protein